MKSWLNGSGIELNIKKSRVPSGGGEALGENC